MLFFKYETKCRRCGFLCDWAGLSYKSEDKALKYRSFLEQMRGMIDYPRLMDCAMCEKNTVQDLVSYETSTD